MRKVVKDCIWDLYQRNWSLDESERKCRLTFPVTTVQPLNGTIDGLSDSPLVSSSVSPSTEMRKGVKDCIWELYQRNWPLIDSERACRLTFSVTTVPLLNGTVDGLSDSPSVSSSNSLIAKSMTRESRSNAGNFDPANSSPADWMVDSAVAKVGGFGHYWTW